MLENVLAAGVALVCLALLLRMALPAAQQARWDRAQQRLWARVQAVGQGLAAALRRARGRRQARREADSVIERARRPPPDVQRTGNVIRPRSFQRGDDDDEPRPPTLH